MAWGLVDVASQRDAVLVAQLVLHILRAVPFQLDDVLVPVVHRVGGRGEQPDTVDAGQPFVVHRGHRVAALDHLVQPT
jgi:hypothetical protein